MVLIIFVLSEVSSMKASLSRWLRMNGWRRVIQNCRVRTTSGRICSLGSSVFFVRESEPVQPATNRRAMHFHPMIMMRFLHQFVQRKVASKTLKCAFPVRLPNSLIVQKFSLFSKYFSLLTFLGNSLVSHCNYDRIRVDFGKNPPKSQFFPVNSLLTGNLEARPDSL